MVMTVRRDPEYSPVSHQTRRRMLREIIHHQEAQNKAEWELPPVEPGDHATSYTEMMQDPTVSYSVDIIKEAILAEPWHIEPAEKARGAVAMAEDVRKNLADVDIEAALEDALSAIWRGFWAHEIAWRFGQRRHWLDTLAAVDADQIAFELDDKMRVTAILSKPGTGAEDQRLPADKIWLHVHRPSRTRPAGVSILEPAYRAWSSKNRLLQFWGLSIQRFGSAQWMIQVPENMPTTKKTEILDDFYAGRLDGVYMVSEAVAASQLNPVQWANQTYEGAIDYQDGEIVKAILLQRNPGGNASGQTYVTGAGLDVQSRSTAYRLSRISRSVAISFTRQVIHPLCLSNWGAPPAQCPSLVLAAPDHQRLVSLAAPLVALRGAGIADPDTAAQQLGLPVPTEPAPSMATPNEDQKGGRKSTPTT